MHILLKNHTQTNFSLTKTVNIFIHSSSIKLAYLPQCAIWVSISWKSHRIYPHSSFIVSQIQSLTIQPLLQRLWRSVSWERRHLTETQWPPWKVCVLLFCSQRKCNFPETGIAIGSLKGKGKFLFTCFFPWRRSLWQSTMQKPLLPWLAL